MFKSSIHIKHSDSNKHSYQPLKIRIHVHKQEVPVFVLKKSAEYRVKSAQIATEIDLGGLKSTGSRRPSWLEIDVEQATRTGDDALKTGDEQQKTGDELGWCRAVESRWRRRDVF